MIVIRIISGPHAGKVREIVDGEFDGVPINSDQLLMQLFELGSRWELDLSVATGAEIFDWGRSDMVVRYFRALVEERPVIFMGVEYFAKSAEEITEVVQRIEDVIVASGHNVFLEYDDERGVSIGTHGTEYKLQ